MQQHYLQKCLQQVEQFFHAYYRGGCNYLDEQYFVRGNYDWQLCPNSLYFDTDTSFSTPCDQTVVRLLAYDLLQEYIQKQQAKDKVPGDTITIIGGQKQKVNWTASKTDLVELVYALHAATVFNNGSASLRNIITCFQQVFNIELGDHYRLWLHIRARKTVRAKFLEALLKLLENRLTGDDPCAEN